MMDTIVAVYLFVVIFSILCWLVTPENVMIGEGDIMMNADYLVHQDTLGSRDAEKLNYEEMGLSEEVNDNYKDNIELLETEINKLTARQARKIAGKLNIPQKINGKDAPKHLLIQQIQLKANTQQQQVAEALQQVIHTV
ncbi:hypothetical protein H6G27_23990 [Nostoc linckia FACHB-104]|nr:hypothetical protein [Nostoc linckia FACHB-104]